MALVAGRPHSPAKAGAQPGLVCAVTVAEHTTLDDEACIFMHLVGPLVPAPARPGDPVRGRVNHVLAGRPARRPRVGGQVVMSTSGPLARAAR